jgi:5-methylcytosine-specific restriction protein A
MTRLDFRKRGYTSDWDAVARDFKRRFPICLGCWAVGLETPTEIVDHVVPLAYRADGLLDYNNLQPSCGWHHQVIKRHLELMWKLGQLPESALRLDSVHAMKLTRERYLVPVRLDGFKQWEWRDLKRRPYPTGE